MISTKEVKHIAKLARLGLTPTDIKKFQKELSVILDYIEKLKEVDISKIELVDEIKKIAKHYSFIGFNSFRSINDITRPDKSNNLKTESKKVLELAPATKDGYLKTKSILK